MIEFNNISVNESAIADLCRENGIIRLSLFGSILRQDFNADSDVDVLVVFDPKASIDLYDICVLQESLARIFGRNIDLVEEKALKNPFRRREIMERTEVLYAA